MKDLLNNGFQPVSETEMVMVEGGSPSSDRNTEHGPDPWFGHDGGSQYPKQPKKGGGGGNGNSYSDR
ncbi:MULTISPECIES: hypothetical protein [unclassified Treponema]|uniref:hypothetical protein n=1 Tax=unclassified Treponema TaxID=2638727 RepID=UPI0020A5007D|nr:MULTISPECIES: hypothetical protein [unclassified Treponema]UTC67191.1 hypothetical protein E4O06_00515 [Treponema sp. OMZ 789]UTC69921.1 hypothetical protein E4O01_00515 [Treponema sp. OMZ 790]UTC72636.1 hypothetical protein E4O02_00515 [Treponema sp. OMZ 791]